MQRQCITHAANASHLADQEEPSGVIKRAVKKRAGERAGHVANIALANIVMCNAAGSGIATYIPYDHKIL